ncbi:MAG: hypothetical protein ACRDZ8_03850 [Acidimicrobiales bacterium]
MRPRSIKLNIPVAICFGMLAIVGIPAPVAAATSTTPDPFVVNTILSGNSLHHRFTPSGGSPAMSDPLTKPDDVTMLDGHLFVGFQNGVGPQGEASSDGNLDSTVVELDARGRPIGQWDIAGKADGVTADPALHAVIATVNEDANSSLYTITPTAPATTQVVQYRYNEPLPHDGGTDAISVDGGRIFISASAPGTSGPALADAPEVYAVRLDASTMEATVTALFADNAEARVANRGSTMGQPVALALTDPDSSEVVPAGAARFGGAFVLDSQGDQEQVYVEGAGADGQRLEVLSLSQSVDDTAWPTRRGGRLFATDATHNAIDVVLGAFTPGQALAVATPCGSNNAPATCPAPGFANNFLAAVNPSTGAIVKVPVTGAAFLPQGGLLYAA